MPLRSKQLAAAGIRSALNIKSIPSTHCLQFMSPKTVYFPSSSPPLGMSDSVRPKANTLLFADWKSPEEPSSESFISGLCPLWPDWLWTWMSHYICVTRARECVHMLMQFGPVRLNCRENTSHPLIKACITPSDPIASLADEQQFGHTQSCDFHPLY